MTEQTAYKRGDRVRITRCPTNDQHRNMEATVTIEASAHTRLTVQLASGAWCWPFTVEPLPHDDEPVDEPTA